MLKNYVPKVGDEFTYDGSIYRIIKIDTRHRLYVNGPGSAPDPQAWLFNMKTGRPTETYLRCSSIARMANNGGSGVKILKGLALNKETIGHILVQHCKARTSC